MKRPEITKRDARNFFLGAAVMVIIMAVIDLFKPKSDTDKSGNHKS